MLAAMYRRVSDPKQARDDRYSLAVQDRTIRAVAAARGDEIVAVYTDAGRTAYRDELEFRPEFARMLQEAPVAPWKRVYVLALDRFSRASMAASGEWVRTLERAGVDLVSCMEWFDSSPSGEWLRTILLGQARFSSRLQGEKVAGALREKQAQGKWVGVRPYGYKAGPDRALVEDEDAAAGYRLAVRLVLEGEENISQVCRMLNVAGFRTGRGGLWHPKAMFKILRSPVYLGLIALPDGSLLPGQHPPLLARPEWELLQARLRQSARPQSGARPRGCYPLSGILHCARCGSHMIGASPADRRPCYVCARRGRFGRIHAGVCFFYATACEELIATILDGIRLGPGWREAVEAELQAPPRPGPTAAEIRAQERRLMDMYQAGAYGDDAAEFKRRWAELQALRQAQAPPHRAAVLQIGDLLEAGLGAIWRAAPDGATKRRLARILFRAVYITGEAAAQVELARPVEWQPEVAALLRHCAV